MKRRRKERRRERRRRGRENGREKRRGKLTSFYVTPERREDSKGRRERESREPRVSHR